MILASALPSEMPFGFHPRFVCALLCSGPTTSTLVHAVFRFYQINGLAPPCTPNWTEQQRATNLVCIIAFDGGLPMVTRARATTKEAFSFSFTIQGLGWGEQCSSAKSFTIRKIASASLDLGHSKRRMLCNVFPVAGGIVQTPRAMGQTPPPRSF